MKLKLRKAQIQFFALMIAGLLAQPSNLNAAPQAVSEAEVKSLFQKYEGIESLKVEFDQVKILKDIPTKLKSKGRLELTTPETLVWTLTEPSFLEFKLVAGNAQITTGQGDAASVQKFTKAQMASSAQASSLQGLTSWLKFDSGYLTHAYKVMKLESGKLEFTPVKPKASPFTKIELEFSKAKTVKHLTLHEPSGDLIELEFQNPLIKKMKQAQ